MENEILNQNQTIPTPPTWSNKQLTEAYLSSIALLSPVTIYNWQRFFVMILNDIDKSLLEVTTTDLRNYIIKKKTDGRWKSITTLQLAIVKLKTFFKFLVLERYLDDAKNPAKGLKSPPNGSGGTYRTITLKEIRLLLKAVEGPLIELREKLLFYIAITSGLRAKEIISIKKENIDLEKRLIFLPKEDVKGKYRERRVPISKRTKEVLESYLIKYPSPISNIFFNHWGKPLRRDYVYYAMKNIIDVAFPYKNSWNKPYGSHLARHTFCTRWIESGGDIHALRAIMGWSSFSQLDRYVSVSPNFISKAAMKVEQKMYSGKSNETDNT